MLQTGKPVCSVSTLAIASARFDLNLFKSKPLGLRMATALAESFALPSPTAFSAEVNALASLASASSAMRGISSNRLGLGLVLLASVTGASLGTRLCGRFHRDRRQRFHPSPQIVAEYQRAPSTFDGAQCAGSNTLIKGRAPAL